MSVGDRPIFPLPNHRLDRAKFDLVSLFAQAAQSRTLGALFGGHGGLLSRLDYTLTYPLPDTVVFHLGACRIAWSRPTGDGSGVFDGGVLEFDPTREGQSTTTLELQGFQGKNFVILAKRSAAPVAVDIQGHYQNGVKYAATHTVEQEIALLDAVADDADISGSIATGWVRIAYGLAGEWSDLTPVVRPIYFPDSTHWQADGGGMPANKWSDIANESDPTAGDNFDGLSLGSQLLWIFNVLARILDNTWEYETDGRIITPGNEGWRTAPPIGLSQTKDQLDDHDDRLEALEANTAGAALAGGVIKWNGTAFEIESKYENSGIVLSVATQQVVVASPNDGYECRLTWTGATVKSYHVTLENNQIVYPDDDQPALLWVAGPGVLPLASGTIRLAAQKKHNESSEASFAPYQDTYLRFVFTLF